MKTGKRILSVLLAVLMAASCLTFAFAEANEEEPLYVIFKLPTSVSWDLDTLDVCYQDDVSHEIYSIIKDVVFNDKENENQTGMVIRYDDFVYNSDIVYQAFFVPNSEIGTFHQNFEEDANDLQLWHFASGKIDNSFFYVLADYNSPFVITVDAVNGSCSHIYEIKGLQNSSCTTETTGSYYCSECGQSLSIKFPACHIYGEDVLRTRSSCTEGYVYSHYCARCKAVESENGSPLGHNYVKREPVAATCFTEGYTPEKCTRCQKIQMTDIKPATGKHKDDNNDNHCDVCGTLMTAAEEAPEKPAEETKQNFFQRIIEWFRNLFSKLFK